ERDRDWIVREDGLAITPALMQTHAAAAAQVDRRDDDHRPLFTTAAKFSSMRSPHRWLFSGWNCVAWIRPTSIAAATLTPYSHQATRRRCTSQPTKRTPEASDRASGAPRDCLSPPSVKAVLTAPATT